MLMSTLPRSVEQAEPELRVIEMDTLVHATDKGLSQEHMLAGLSGFFGLVALILAAVGFFGVISCTVGRRTREIGIRMAMGARHGTVLWMVLRETLVLLAAGLGLGVPVVFAGGRLVASLLYGLEPTDPVTLTLAVLVLSGVALLAGYIPARRAAKVDPMVALRYE
jgi:ABC-type antimicrobial peptide transport system permease subunit